MGGRARAGEAINLPLVITCGEEGRDRGMERGGLLVILHPHSTAADAVVNSPLHSPLAGLV